MSCQGEQSCSNCKAKESKAEDAAKENSQLPYFSLYFFSKSEIRYFYVICWMSYRFEWLGIF